MIFFVIYVQRASSLVDVLVRVTHCLANMVVSVEKCIKIFLVTVKNRLTQAQHAKKMLASTLMDLQFRKDLNICLGNCFFTESGHSHSKLSKN